LSKVFGPDVTNGNSLTQETDLSYSTTDDLKTVTQGVQARNYTYDDLGRLLTAKIPETNQVATSYAYNGFNLVSQRTDARGVITTYSYDNLNRISQISYNVGTTGVPATPTVTMTYDEGGAAANSLGHLTTLTDGTGTEKYVYNNLGLMTQLTKTVNGTQYPLVYAYNLSGELTSLTYPSGRVVQDNYDAIGRLCAVGSSGATCTPGANYLSGFAYNTASQVTGFNYGNGVAATFTYSADRLQMQALSYAKGSQTLASLNYWYKTDATNCPNASAGNNGQIQCITDNVDSGRGVTYTYDSLYRLSTAITNGSTAYPKWGLSWSYDRYGNRNAQSIISGCVAPMTCPTSSVTVDTTTNRISGSPYAHDFNGNMTNDGANTLSYDGENHAVTAAGSTYAYDGNGLRVRKCAPNCTSPISSTTYIFSGTKVIAEYDNGTVVSAPSREYVYAGAVLLAKFEGGATMYYHADHLSNRVLSDASGNVVGQRGHFPYGETWYESGTTTKLQFTSYERDSETGNDFAMARYGVNRLGRFSSLDPVGGSGKFPQSLGHYSYVQSDPINARDPSGKLMAGLYIRMSGGSVGDTGCEIDGLDSSCSDAHKLLDAGFAEQCPNNVCNYLNKDNKWIQFRAYADGSSGYVPFDSPAGYSVHDIANARAAVKEAEAAAQGTPIDPGSLSGRGKEVYDHLIALGVSPGNITIYQGGTQSFTAVLNDEGFDQLQNAQVDSNFGDAFLHYPYTDGGRDNNNQNSLHFVWFDENLTDYMGGSGVYMQFHLDSSNPYAGGFWQHWGCDVFHITCHH